MKDKIIYIVDDDADDRYLIKIALEEFLTPLEIREFGDGLELLKYLQGQQLPDSQLILIDMNMPRLDGVETTKEIRANPQVSNSNIVMLSTTSDLRLIKTAYAAGINEFYQKPSNYQELKNAVEKILKKYLNISLVK